MFYFLSDCLPESTRSNTLVIYPNPGKGIFTVLGENVNSVRVTRLSGKVVCVSQTPIFDLSNQPTSIYFVAVKTDQTTVVKKIIKN
ncbi:T9SS type A sorting domain-containing protein [Aquipluma nitroreducens]|uniref:T9SS type A sorting domain-containing protein n=1 Tax=Aquipluma nitroreducens TaxID=2010828 RepID=UPI00384AC9B1